MVDFKKIVKEGYGNIAKCSVCCCDCKKMRDAELAKSIGYSDDDLKTPGNLGLGCGNPTALGKIKAGDVVLDLGSGAGFDCFLVSKKVGSSGKVIGVDFSEEMLSKARENASKYGYENVEFRQGDIESLPLENNSVDVVISNCVINLAPDKSKVFEEAFRVLKTGGKLYVSDIVLLEELSEEKKNDENLMVGCVAGALLKEKYLDLMGKAGFEISILSEDKEISKTQYQGINLESLKVEGSKK